jgi:serine/threonine-protein kinase RsbW
LNSSLRLWTPSGKIFLMTQPPAAFRALHPGADSTPVPFTWSRTFPATPNQVPRARRFLADILNGSLLTPDALLCLSELVTNAIEHSQSARPGGRFTVRASIRPGSLRVEVEDEGGPWHPTAQHNSQRGRGLCIVAALARDWNITGDGTTTPRIVWFELG